MNDLTSTIMNDLTSTMLQYLPPTLSVLVGGVLTLIGTYLTYHYNRKTEYKKELSKLVVALCFIREELSNNLNTMGFMIDQLKKLIIEENWRNKICVTDFMIINKLAYEKSQANLGYILFYDEKLIGDIGSVYEEIDRSTSMTKSFLNNGNAQSPASYTVKRENGVSDMLITTNDEAVGKANKIIGRINSVIEQLKKEIR